MPPSRGRTPARRSPTGRRRASRVAGRPVDVVPKGCDQGLVAMRQDLSYCLTRALDRPGDHARPGSGARCDARAGRALGPGQDHPHRRGPRCRHEPGHALPGLPRGPRPAGRACSASARWPASSTWSPTPSTPPPDLTAALADGLHAATLHLQAHAAARFVLEHEPALAVPVLGFSQMDRLLRVARSSPGAPPRPPPPVGRRPAGRVGGGVDRPHVPLRPRHHHPRVRPGRPRRVPPPGGPLRHPRPRPDPTPISLTS